MSILSQIDPKLIPIIAALVAADMSEEIIDPREQIFIGEFLSVLGDNLVVIASHNIANEEQAGSKTNP